MENKSNHNRKKIIKDNKNILNIQSKFDDNYDINTNTNNNDINTNNNYNIKKKSSPITNIY